MKKILLLNSLLFFTIGVFGQQSLNEQIYKAYNISFSDIEAAKNIITSIDESLVKTLPDSSRFNYHYACAGIASANEDKNGVIHHLQETKHLCESSIGIRQVVYLEIMNALASAYEDKDDLDSALAIYQEGIVKGLPIRNWEGAMVEFGNLNSGLASLYEKKGWLKEVPDMWRNAWDFWPKEDASFKTYNVYPLFMLSNYYERQGEYSKALEINKEMYDYSLSYVGQTDSIWCDILYQKGTILGHQGKYEDAVKIYSEGIAIAKKNGIKGEKLVSLYGNFICSLAEYETLQNIDIVLAELQKTCPQIYSQALFNVGLIYEKNKHYKEAIDYVCRAKACANVEEQEKYDWYIQLYTSEYNNQQVLNTLNSSTIPNKGTNEWFVYMEKLANASYYDKDKKSAENILLTIINESVENKIPEQEKFRFINMLVGCAADINDYATVLKFSKEWIEYAKKTFGEESKEYFASLSTTAIGYIKTNDYKRADSMLELCTPLCIALFGKKSEQYAAILHNNGRVAQLTGELKSAKAFYNESLYIFSLMKTPISRTKRTRECLGEVELLLKEQL